MEKLLFEDTTLGVYYNEQTDGNSLLIITFNEMGLRFGEGAWGKSVLEKINLSYIGFVSKSPNWFFESSFEQALAIVYPLLEKYDHIVTYGFSQGGYAAIRFAKRLKAKTIIAMSPQYSINPQAMSGLDKRFCEYYIQEEEQPPIQATDVDIDSFIALFYDPFDVLDELNKEFILAAIPHTNIFKVYNTGHQTVHIFSGSEKLRVLLKTCLNRDKQKIQKLIYCFKKSWQHRPIFLARNTAKKKPQLTKAILKKSWSLLDGESAIFLFKELQSNENLDFLYENVDKFLLSIPNEWKLSFQKEVLNFLVVNSEVYKASLLMIIWLWSGLFTIDDILQQTKNGFFSELEGWIIKQLQTYTSNESVAYLAGWYYQEQWGRWSKSCQAYMVIKNSEAFSQEVMLWIKPLSNKQKLSIKVYNNLIWNEIFPNETNQYPVRIEAKQNCILELSVNMLFSPASLNHNSDNRLMGLAIENVKLENEKA